MAGGVTREFVRNLWHPDTGHRLHELPPVGERVSHLLDEEALGVVLAEVKGPWGPSEFAVEVLWSRMPEYGPKLFQTYLKSGHIDMIKCNVTIK